MRQSLPAPWVRHLSRIAIAVASVRPRRWDVTPLVRAKVETWRQEGPTAFAKCHREGVVISDNGRVRLGHALAPLGSLAAERVWDLAQTRDGIVYAATGDAGKVFRREPTADAPWTLVYDSSDTQVSRWWFLPMEPSMAGPGPTAMLST